MPQVKCSECGGQGSCYCQKLNGFTSHVLSYKYIFFCQNCGKEETRVENIPYEIWGTLNYYFSICPFCGFCRKQHSKIPLDIG